MRSRVAIGLATAILVALGSSPAQARAADTVIAHDTSIVGIHALGNDLVYYRAGKQVKKRVWMARYKGHLRRARGIPDNIRVVSPGDIGLDAKGRKVFTFVVEHRNKSRVTVSTKWFVYDLARNRTRPLGGHPAKCLSGFVAVWRGRTAYTATCNGGNSGGLFLREGSKTRRLTSDLGQYRLVFRGGTLAEVFDTGLDDFVVREWMANGKVCERFIYPSYGDATGENGWAPSGLWVTGDSLTWEMGRWAARPNFAILTAKIPAGCETPGPVGKLAFTPETAKLNAMAVDGRRLFYADDTTLRKHTLPAQPSFDPPPNDDFEHAQQLPAEPPFSVTGPTAYATVQPGEPLADTKHTIWYAWRPTTSRRVTVGVSGNPIWDFNENHYVGTYRYGVYTGTSRDNLTEVPTTDAYGTRFDAVAGQTYWISVGSPIPEPNYQPILVSVNPG